MATNAHLVASPCVVPAVAVAAGKRQYVPFPFVTRSLRVRASADAALSFAGPDAARLEATEDPLLAAEPFSEQVQTPGVWLVNDSEAEVTFSVFAVVGDDDPASWPAYGVGVETAITLPTAVDLPE